MSSAHRDTRWFTARACAGFAEQERQLRALAGSGWFLELDPVRAKSVAHRSQPWLFQVSGEGGPFGVAAGIVREGRTQRGLHVTLVRPLAAAAAAAFWSGLRAFAEEQRIAAVSVASFGETRPEIPHLPGETAREQASGCRSLHLGISSDERLVRFKAGFGARPVEVEKAAPDARRAAARVPLGLLRLENVGAGGGVQPWGCPTAAGGTSIFFRSSEPGGFGSCPLSAILARHSLSPWARAPFSESGSVWSAPSATHQSRCPGNSVDQRDPS